MRRFINAASVQEIVFLRGTTEAINLVAQTYGRTHVGAGDEVLISAMEHHSNIVPWQMLCEEKGARLRIVPINQAGEFVFEQYEKLLGPRTRLVAVTSVSNSLGTINPVRENRSARPRTQRSGIGRRSPGDSAHAHRRTGARLRFLRILRP